MGLYFRKSVRFGPLRLNLSGHGIGYSLGATGLRVGRSSTGRRYTSMSLPGTGLRYISYQKSSSRYVRRPSPLDAGAVQPAKGRGCGSCGGCLVAFVVIIALLTLLGEVVSIVQGTSHG
ncbi:MAG: DUF4236 domain-containing protein [Phycisphaerales bacterium]|nr:DUF4236 domain-containing protein [Phycisphaerales bacterium]